MLITKYLNIISLARLMDRQIYLYYRVLKGIINNRNSLFISKFWSKLYNITEIKYKLLIAYHPRRMAKSSGLTRNYAGTSGITSLIRPIPSLGFCIR